MTTVDKPGPFSPGQHSRFPHLFLVVRRDIYFGDGMYISVYVTAVSAWATMGAAKDEAARLNQLQASRLGRTVDNTYTVDLTRLREPLNEEQMFMLQRLKERKEKNENRAESDSEIS